MKDPQSQAIDALRSISRNEEVKAYILQNPHVYGPLLKVAMRFIGGETLEECFKTAKTISKKGHTFTVDFMGESTRDRKTANAATEEFLRVIDKIVATKSDASVSLDLSHIGMVIDRKLGHQNAVRIAQKAKEHGIEMMISMEGIERIDSILEEYYLLAKEYDNVGITLQAYLHRTEKDLKKALEFPEKIRLVKGAYKVSPKFALPWGKETDEAYKKYVKIILKKDHLCSLATHDEKILSFANTFIRKNKNDKKNIEFEMLHGATPQLLDKMHEKGYRTRDYLPYGKEWYLYVCHRLAENLQNIFQALADAIEAK